VVFYLASLFFGFLVVLPMWSLLDRFAGQTLMGRDIAQGLDADFLFELIAYNSGSLPGLAVPLFAFAIYWLVMLFLSGGALSVFARGDGYQPAAFWGASAKYFGRFLRLALWSLILVLVVALLPLLAVGLQRLFFGADPYQNVIVWGSIVQTGLALLGLAFVGICFDYGRVHAVLNDEKKMRRSLWHGVRFTFRNFAATVGLALLLLIVSTVVLATYRPVSNLLGAPTTIAVLLLFFLQQIYMVWRVLMRLTRYGAEIELYRVRSAREEGSGSSLSPEPRIPSSGDPVAT
jgi:hypothetical protein